MHNEEPAAVYYCCGARAKWIILTPSIAYFYCEVCKKEVDSCWSTKKRDFLNYLDLVNKGVKK